MTNTIIFFVFLGLKSLTQDNVDRFDENTILKHNPKGTFLKLILSIQKNWTICTTITHLLLRKQSSKKVCYQTIANKLKIRIIFQNMNQKSCT